MASFERHIFVCINERTAEDPRGFCAAVGGAEVAAKMKITAYERGLKRVVRVNKSGCLDQCAFGPTVVVYPGGVWYSPQTQDEVHRICEEHIEGGVVVDDLLIPGLN